ncbi:hypothetical protein A2841_02830 [Candidatus Kaiserbacteria bacterium RIFCSPHIGHO2_01_FULL_48_10]|uniref:PDZ domain-containing protein n=1 Tax=Candidatus Kaiserbacteria bacterium RIFCSPHIGHO2_01_FULL_48_10 TaxID=1798476 RepID=A0A1F6C5D1_9BACT|nr:MAG: hypothetical protein A2841_02830 [Candidatus Kaiserbacteria bacterium RIFCSPHIGHO2_01_FULL_48_10]
MSIILFIIILVVLVVGHEFGHFLAAKAAKMKVLEFGIGFPPKLWGKKVGETEYSVNALPFGGFVKIFGEDPTEPLRSGFADSRRLNAEGTPNKIASTPIYGSGAGKAFYEKSELAQAGVLCAGPFANFLLAFIFSTAAFIIGTSVVVDETNSTSATNQRVLVTQVLAGGPAEKAGMTVGDRMVSVSRGSIVLPVQTPEDVLTAVSMDGNEPVVVSVVRGGETLSFTMTPQIAVIPDEPERKVIGVATSLVGTVSLPLSQAVARGFTETIEKLVLVTTGLFSLIGSAVTLSADLSGIAGPVGIASITGEVATFGIGALLSFAALISLNLFIINLLPFPALDGGRLAFLAVETVVRRKIPIGVSNTLNTIGFALLIALMIAVTAHDISRLVG